MADQDNKVPDLYADSVQMGASPFGVVLTFGMRPPGVAGTAQPIQVCNLRMSLEHAKVMSMMLRRQLKAFEEQMGEQIPLHPQIWQQMGFSRQEDW